VMCSIVPTCCDKENNACGYFYFAICCFHNMNPVKKEVVNFGRTKTKECVV
jgi:hypothetical protein